ncbi:MAG: DUF1824 family protein [Cyanobacteria bacterium REEB459]|nr:DUF1824 family protein [Cyanobacteria bacterium REEB459]
MTFLPGPQDLVALRQRLNQFSALTTPPPLSSESVQQLRADLGLLNRLSDYQTLGICADDLEQARRAIAQYLGLLGVNATLTLPEQAGAVYLKFNTLKGTWYLDGYSGQSRGVIITFHGSDPEAMAVIGTYGPFPFQL